MENVIKLSENDLKSHLVCQPTVLADYSKAVSRTSAVRNKLILDSS